MAMLISRATGNFTSASTWGVADSATGSQLTNLTASTNTTTSYVYSSTFTGTNTRVSDGIALFMKRLTTTGTVSVALSDDNGVTATREVTVNASDLPADESWVFFKFGTTLTLDGGTDYRVGVVASSADNALIYRNATAGNWGRMVSTTTTAAPATADTLLIVGEWTGAGASSSYTVTFDSTSTTLDLGILSTITVPTQTTTGTFSGVQIGQNGTLSFGVSSSVNYYLRISGNLVVWSGGTYNMGTSGAPCPRDSTMTLYFDGSGGASPMAYAMKGSVFNAYGQSRTNGKDFVSCKLSANAAINATSLTVDTDTGWLDNDRIAVATTTRTQSQSETGLLNGAAGASTLTVDGFAGTAGGLAFSHDGVSPAQAEIILLTRNVKIILFAGSTIAFGIGSGTTAAQQSTAQVNIRWVEFQFCGINLYAISPGFADIQYCSFWSDVVSVLLTSTSLATSNCTFSNNVGFTSSSSLSVTLAHSTAGANNFVQNNIFITSSSSSTIYTVSVTNAATNSGTFSGNTAVGGASGFSISTNRYSFSNLTAHSNSATGITFNTPHTASNFTAWRCVTGINAGVNTTTFSATTEINGLVVFGCSTTNISATGVFRFTNGTIAGDTSFSSPLGLTMAAASSNFSVCNLVGCNFSPTSGIYVPHTTADISLSATVKPQMTLSDTALRATTEIDNTANMTQYGFVKSSKHDQTEGSFKSWFYSGVIERDTTIYNTASPSERLTPSSATIKLQSGSRLVAVDDLGTVTINAYVRKSVVGDGAAYNGNQPRLVLKANPACGINADVVLDTMTAAAGSWEQLTGTTAAVDADGALEFYVDCDGTTGWVNVDDWTVS